MQQIGHVSCGWGWLERQLNNLIDNINARGVIPSATVAVMETPGGFLLSVQQPAIQQSAGGDGQGGLPKGWYQFTWTGVSWAQLQIVNPSDCSSQLVNVLCQSPGESLIVALYFDPSKRTDSATADETFGISIQ